jgi:Cu(I)/Ag(I) efflux system membrane fusion protein
MDLIPVTTAGSFTDAGDPDAITLSKEAVALADIQTVKAERGKAAKEIRLYGTIRPNERLARAQVSHVSGRIEKLFVHFAGETVRQGQVIASVYSPDLQNAQQELLEAAAIEGSQPSLLAAAREKLRRWKLTGEQIASIERSGNVSPLIDIVANTGGIVTAKRVEQGDYVESGTALFDLTDLSSVWAVFDAYEADLPYLKTGDRVEYTLQALPGKRYTGRISFIDPALDKTTRTAKVRVETPNPDLSLKPEMYAGAVIHASLGKRSGEIIIPQTAALWTGKRSIVYVKQPGSDMPVFKLREIELGSSLGDSYIVLSGLAEGEEIVSAGVFAVDASAQLESRRSMMNNNGAPDAGEAHAMLMVQGLCEMCRKRIETAAKGVAGVVSATWDRQTRQLRFSHRPQETSPDAVAQAVARAGHDTENYKAGNNVYDALPECCHYRKE